MKKQIKMELIDEGKYTYFYHQKGHLGEKQVSKVEDGYNQQTATASSKHGMFRIWSHIVIKNWYLAILF